MKSRAAAWLLMAAGLGLIGLGTALGHPAQVMARAIRICMECVGLG